MGLRQIQFSEAILEATRQCMEADRRVYVMGLGVPDPKGTFGTTLGLQEIFGEKRVLDMPTSENGMTGVAVGSALVGMRPLMTHQRVDFTLLAMDQIINNAAKWHYMFGGRMKVPLVIRMVIGRGWGQGPQHSQCLQGFFAHVPGLKVVMPATAHDAKGLLISAIEDDNPVIFIEHRWLHMTIGSVPEEMYRVPLGKASLHREGTDVSLVASSYMTLEALRAAEHLEKLGVSAEVVDLRSLKPLDEETVLGSVRKTGRLVAVDHAWRSVGFAAELLALAAEGAYDSLKSAPRRVTLPDLPTPSTPALANAYYPRAIEIVNAALETLGRSATEEDVLGIRHDMPLDVPDKSFIGPF